MQPSKTLFNSLKLLILLAILINSKVAAQFNIIGPSSFNTLQGAEDYLKSLTLDFQTPEGLVINNEGEIGHGLEIDDLINDNPDELQVFNLEGNGDLPPLPVDDIITDQITNNSLEQLLSNIDSDDDAENLEAIRSRILLLDNQLDKDFKDLRDYKRTVTLDENNSFVVNSPTYGDRTTLSDLHEELQKIRLNSILQKYETTAQTQQYENNQTEFIEGLENEEEDQTSEPIQAIVDLAKVEDYNQDIPSDVKSAKIPLYGRVSEVVGSNFDLLDVSSIWENAITFEEVCNWIAFVIGVYCIFQYCGALKTLALEAMTDLIRASESNPVTNYSILGNSVGALTVKAFKMGILVPALLTIFASITILLSETIGTQWGDIAIWEVVSNIKGLFNSDSFHPFFGRSWYWFNMLVPLTTIVSLYGFYWLNAFLFKGGILASNRLARAFS